MKIAIENEWLKVIIDSYGAQMQSIQSKDGTEYLWQGDIKTWNDRAINLFPYIARLTEKTYCYQGIKYRMENHGFVKDLELKISKQTKDKVCFTLCADKETRKQYPFEFCYSIEYVLIQNKIQILLKVENRDKKIMYFGLGGHPGFQVPIDNRGTFEDYYLEFAKKANPYQVGMSKNCFVTGEDSQFPLVDGRKLLLRHDLFDHDAIILRNMCRSVTLKSEKNTKSVTVEYPKMDYLGIWHWPKTVVNYICIEPWSSLPSRDGIIEDLEEQENLISLEQGKIYENQWNIIINDIEKYPLK